MATHYPLPDQTMSELIQKFHCGTGITDKELAELLVFYRRALEDMQTLRVADRSYQHAFCEINRDYLCLEDFQNARARK